MLNLAAFLALASSLEQTVRWQYLDLLDRYFRGRQYEHRQLDAAGYRKGSSVYGSALRSPPWSERDPGAVWNLSGETVRELTGWAVAGDSWCHLEIADDDAAEDWLGTIAQMANLGDVVAKARDYGGSQGTAIVSFGFQAGELLLEAHNPKDCWVLEWADPKLHRPRVVAKVYKTEDPFAKSKSDYALACRVWTETEEILSRRERSKEGDWTWVEVERTAHNLGSCPVYWHPQLCDGVSHDGTPDGEADQGEVDEANELMSGAGLTTKRNSDDTMVIKTDPKNNDGKTMKKGGFSTIWSEGGAEYLSQNGDSARICMDVAKMRAEHVYRRRGLARVDQELLGKATSGEVLRRIYQLTIKTAATVRRDYARGLIVPLCQGILRAARLLEARGLGVTVPPRVTKDALLGTVNVEPRVPGKSEFVTCLWPDPFPPTVADLKAMLDAAVSAVGNKQVLSLESAIAWIKTSPLPVSSVEEEKERIQEEQDAAAERQQTAFGLAPDAPGAAGPIGAKEPTGKGQEAEESGGKVAAE